MTDPSPKPDPTLSPDIQQHIADLRATRPYDGRRVTLRESHGGWKFEGLTGICMHLADDRHHMVLKVEHDPEGYWPIGMEILAELDHESVPMFHGEPFVIRMSKEFMQFAGLAGREEG